MYSTAAVLGSLRTLVVVASVNCDDRCVRRQRLVGAIAEYHQLGGIGIRCGMVVDNAIVVIENIFTHTQQGKVDCSD